MPGSLVRNDFTRSFCLSLLSIMADVADRQATSAQTSGLYSSSSSNEKCPVATAITGRLFACAASMSRGVSPTTQTRGLRIPPSRAPCLRHGQSDRNEQGSDR